MNSLHMDSLSYRGRRRDSTALLNVEHATEHDHPHGSGVPNQQIIASLATLGGIFALAVYLVWRYLL